MANHNDMCIGIDLGTTNSVMAWGRIDPNKGLIEPKVVDIKMFDREMTVTKDRLLPSYVYFEEKENHTSNYDHLPIVGEYGKYLIGPQEERVVKFSKLKMGESHTYKIDSEYYTPPQIATRILRKLKESAEETLFRSIPFPNDVVIAIPISFGKKQRKATKKAGEYGQLFENVILVEEPIATLYDFNNQLLRNDILDLYDFNEPRKVLVFDLGGGTLDVSLHKVSYGKTGFDLDVCLIAKSRFFKIAGNKFDKQLAGFLRKEYLDTLPSDLKISKKEMEDLKIKFRLFAEEAKIDLSNKSQLWKYLRSDPLKETDIFTDIGGEAYADKPFRYQLSLEKYEQCIEPLLAPKLTLKSVDEFDPGPDYKHIIDPILDVLKQAQVELDLKTPPKPDMILISGSMARLPTIQKRLERFFDLPIELVLDPEVAIARGAVTWWANEKKKLS